jgi:hypothetical protein
MVEQATDSSNCGDAAGTDAAAHRAGERRRRLEKPL